MNCNNTNLIAWPEGNSVLLRVQVRQPQRDEHGEVVRDQDGNVVYIPLPLDGMDGWAARIVRRPANTVYMVETALDTDDPSVVVMSVPSTQPQGEYSVELTVSKSGANGRSIEVPAFRVVDRNDKANELFTVVNGSRTTDIVLSFSVVPSATTQGKSAYEEWKELPGNENKTLQDYINEVLDLYGITSRAAAATVHAEGAATGAERVNATLSGTMLTVTSRDGQSTSVDTKGPKGDPGTTDYNDLRNRPVIMMATGGLKTSNADESTNSQSIAIGDSASNQGSNSVAIGYHAENRDSPDGRQVYSPSGRQVSIGNHVMATLPNEVVLGNYNVPNGSLFSIGIGTNENNRANLFQISSTGVVSVRRDSAMKTLALTEDLANYYTKNETYTQVQVDQLLQAQLNGEFVTADALPTASESTMCKIYLVPSTNPVVGNVFDEYITLKTEDPQQPGTYFYEWEQIGTTTLDLSNYVQKSLTAGLLRNDGTVDDNTYATQTWVQSQGYLTHHQDISGKEDSVRLQSASGSTLSAAVSSYNRFDAAVSTLAVTLPAIDGSISTVQTVTLYLTADTTPAITITSADSKPVVFADGFEIEAGKTYEISCLYNGSQWVVASVMIDAGGE